jgi:prevent-host-death family protein
MVRVSITEAKNRFSAIIDRVREGETVVVTDRGIPVAEIAPATRLTDDERLDRLERQGLLRRARKPPALHLLDEPPPRFHGSVLEALLEERREGR